MWRRVTDHYLVFDTLHHGSTLRDHTTGHLLSSLGYCANLELHKFPFLQTICLVCHPHDSKGIILAFSSTWNNQEGRMGDILISPRKQCALNVGSTSPIKTWHQPSSVTSISPWYSVWEGSTLRKGRITFPIITVAPTSSPMPFTKKWKTMDFTHFICRHSHLHCHVKHYKYE